MHEVRHVFTQLVRCVEHLHDRGTLHGDIKVTPRADRCHSALHTHAFHTPPCLAVRYVLINTPSR